MSSNTFEDLLRGTLRKTVDDTSMHEQVCIFTANIIDIRKTLELVLKDYDIVYINGSYGGMEQSIEFTKNVVFDFSYVQKCPTKIIITLTMGDKREEIIISSISLGAMQAAVLVLFEHIGIGQILKK